MRANRLFMSFVLLLFSTLAGFAVKKMNIKVLLYDNTVEEYNISSDAEVDFANDYFKITDGEKFATFNIVDISKLYFTEFDDNSVVSVNSVSLSVSPNPATDFITVSGLKNESALAKVVSSNGKILMSVEVKDGEKINISSLEAGVYLLNVEGRIIKFSKK